VYEPGTTGKYDRRAEVPENWYETFSHLPLAPSWRLERIVGFEICTVPVKRLGHV